jgi:hypothetical protein
MKRSAANIVREYGPFPDVSAVRGVSYDGTNVWIATGNTLNAVDPDSGKIARALNVPAHAAPHSMAGTCSRSRTIAFGRLTRSAAVYSGRYRHPKAAPPVWPGGRARSGRAVSQSQDSPSRSADRRDHTHHRVEPLRHGGTTDCKKVSICAQRLGLCYVWVRVTSPMNRTPR